LNNLTIFTKDLIQINTDKDIHDNNQNDNTLRFSQTFMQTLGTNLSGLGNTK